MEKNDLFWTLEMPTYMRKHKFYAFRMYGGAVFPNVQERAIDRIDAYSSDTNQVPCRKRGG